MDNINVLHEFAKAHGIDPSEVKKFMRKYENPSTIEELQALPDDMLNHFRYISDIADPLSEFIQNEIDPERHKTVTLDRIIQCLDDRYDEDDDRVKAFHEYLVRIKFGSVVNDW